MAQVVSVVALVVVLVAAGVLFMRRVGGRLVVLRSGRAVDRTDDVGTRASRELVQVLGQSKLLGNHTAHGEPDNMGWTIDLC